MTTRRIMHKASALFCSALLIAVTFSSAANAALVLCVGDDGHRMLESSVFGTCVSDAAEESLVADQHSQPRFAETDDASHCGPCTDITMAPPSSEFLVVSRHAVAPVLSMVFIAPLLSSEWAVSPSLQIAPGDNPGVSAPISFRVLPLRL